MPFAEHFMLQGKFTVPATLPNVVNVNCGFLPTKIELIDVNNVSASTANENIIRVVWNQDFPSDATNTTMIEWMTASATTMNVSNVSSNGISLYDGHAASPNQLVLGAKIAGTNTAKATGTFTITSTATLFPGATILMTGNTVNKQLGGMFFTVNTVASSTTFTIANASWLNTSSFTNGAETFNVQLVTTPSLYYPQNAQIVNISAANPAVITTSTNTNLSVGQQVRLYVPSVFKMTQANFVTGIVSAVSANQITLGGIVSVNSSAFTAWAWPAASGVPYSPAFVVPMGAGPSATTAQPFVTYNEDTLQDATMSQAFQGFTVGTSILQTASASVIGVTAGDIISWTAWRADV